MLRSHEVSSANSFINGFLPPVDPQRRLAYESENVLNLELNLIVDQLPALLKAKLLRSTIHELDNKYPANTLIKIDQSNSAEMNAAFAILTMLIQAYIWQDAARPARLIPRILSENIFHLFGSYPRVPVQTYADYTLYNWYRIDKKQGITLENIEPLFMFTGSEEEAWFIKIHVVVEAAFSQAIMAAIDIYNLAELSHRSTDLSDTESRVKLFSDCFNRMANSIEQATGFLARMSEKCSPQFFFNVLRPYLEGTDKARGIQFDLPGKEKETFFYRGSSGAQSSTLPALDAILHVLHANNEMSESLRAFLDYMPREHKELILQLQQNSLRSVLPEPTPELRCAAGRLWEFRKAHLAMPAEYVIRQARVQGISIEQVSGTGSTNIGLFLNKRTHDTLEAVIRQSWPPLAKL